MTKEAKPSKGSPTDGHAAIIAILMALASMAALFAVNFLFHPLAKDPSYASPTTTAAIQATAWTGLASAIVPIAAMPLSARRHRYGNLPLHLWFAFLIMQENGWLARTFELTPDLPQTATKPLIACAASSMIASTAVLLRQKRHAHKN